MIETLKEVREALDDACGGRCNAEYNPCWQRQAIDQLDALIAATEKAEPQYLSIERVEGFPEKLEQGPQPLLYSDGINGCMVRRDDVWLALTSQLAIPQPAPQQEKAERVKPMKYLANGTRFKMSFFQNEDGQGGYTDGTNVTCFESFKDELDGRWVALVAAENDCHMKLAAPQSAPQPAPSTSPLTVKQRVDIADACEEMDFDDDYLGIVSKVIDLTEAAHGIGAKP